MLDILLKNLFANQWLVLLLVGGGLIAAAEGGFRFGLRLHHTKDEPRKGQIAGVQGAILGLLALLMGFTFSMAVARYETRRTLVLDEANAIGTTYLRVSLLPESQQTGVKELLRRYVDVRFEFYDAGNNQNSLTAAEKSSAVIQQELWSQAVIAAKTEPGPLVVSFITSLNEVIDLDATRLQALRTHVPGAVWLLVMFVAICGCFATGYGAGANGARSAFSLWLLPMLLTIAITLIADFDRPRGGLIEITQQPLRDLRSSFEPR